MAYGLADYRFGGRQLGGDDRIDEKRVPEEIRRQYVYTARAKGLPEKQILWKHIFRNAMIPLITGFPAAFIGAFFTGSLLIENAVLAGWFGFAVLRGSDET